MKKAVRGFRIVLRRVMIKPLSILCVILIFVGCVAKEPEGPGEQIGKGIDLITKGLGSMDAENSAKIQIEREEREKEVQRQKRELYDERNGVPDHDPYYDTPPKSLDDSYYNDDINSERRY
jgi:Sec-independent protein translocase protein TatA